MKRRLLLLALAWGYGMAQAANVHIVDGSTCAKTVHIFEAGQRIEIPSVEMQAEIAAPGGGSAKADILLIYEPKSGLALWRYQASDPENPGGITERFEQDSVVVAQNERLMEFQLIGSSLWLRESKEKFSTMGDAQRAMLTRIERFGTTAAALMLQSFHEVNLSDALDVDFLHERDNPHPARRARIREASRSGSDWRVVLDGPNGDAVEVTLDETLTVKAVAPVVR
jgi:hypothetical protein